nr:MAG TPA: hypothetical protein [Caudoviricetes sp.]
MVSSNFDLFRVNHSTPVASYHVYTCFGPVYTLLNNTKLVSSNFDLFRVNHSTPVASYHVIPVPDQFIHF